MERPLCRLDAVRRVREEEQPIRPGNDVIGAVQPLAGPGLDHGLDPRPVPVHPRDPAAILLAEDDPAVPGKRLPVGGPGLFAEDLESTGVTQAIGPLGLDILEQKRPV